MEIDQASSAASRNDEVQHLADSLVITDARNRTYMKIGLCIIESEQF